MTGPRPPVRRRASRAGRLAAGLAAGAVAALLLFTFDRRPDPPARPTIARAPAMVVPRSGAEQEFRRRLRCAQLLAAVAAVKTPALRERARTHGLEAVESRHLKYWLPQVRRAARDAQVKRPELEYLLSRRTAVIETPEDMDAAAPAAAACLAEAERAGGRRRS